MEMPALLMGLALLAVLLPPPLAPGPLPPRPASAPVQGIEDGAETPERAREIQSFIRWSDDWRAACVARLTKHWRSRLRRNGYSGIAISSLQEQASATVRLVAVHRGIRVRVEMSWDPDECDAGASNARHDLDSMPPSGLRLAARQAKWPTLDAAANDCFALDEFTSH
jgi:hypothetical protein